MEHLFDKEVKLSTFVKFVTPSVIMLIVIGLYYIIDSIFARPISWVSERLGSHVHRLPGSRAGLGCIGCHAGRWLQRHCRHQDGRRQAAGSQRRIHIDLYCLGGDRRGYDCDRISVFMDQLISFLGATDRLWDMCSGYIRILILGAPAAFLGVLFEYFIRVDGRPGFTLALYLSGGCCPSGTGLCVYCGFKLGHSGRRMGNLGGVWLRLCF